MIKKVLKFVGHRASISSLIKALEIEFRKLNPGASPKKIRKQAIGSIGGASNSGFIKFYSQNGEWVRIR